MISLLPKFFLFNQASDLIRLGRDYDGGYLVSCSDVEKTDLLISMGICDDWSFESDFSKLCDAEILAYDGSLTPRFWLRRSFLAMIANPFNLYPIEKFLSYRRFFTGKRRHIKKFVGLDTTDELHCTFTEVLNVTDRNNIFLKIDIEGSEYRILDEIIENEHRILGIAIEFHDCDIHLDKIHNFIATSQLKLVHVHANNCAPVKNTDRLPLALELTFSKNAEVASGFELPHNLDMPNCKNCPEIVLRIE